MSARFFISLPDSDAVQAAGMFAFRSRGAEGIAAELQSALRTDALFQRWRATQEDPRVSGILCAGAYHDPEEVVCHARRDLQ